MTQTLSCQIWNDGLTNHNLHKNFQTCIILYDSFRLFAYEVFLLLFSCSVGSYPLRPHGLQHSSLLCSSPSPGVCSNSCSLSWWCHPTISSCWPLLPLPSIFPSIKVFPNESALCIRWLKYWSSSWVIQKDTTLGLLSWIITTAGDVTSCDFVECSNPGINGLVPGSLRSICFTGW